MATFVFGKYRPKGDPFITPEMTGGAMSAVVTGHTSGMTGGANKAVGEYQVAAGRSAGGSMSASVSQTTEIWVLGGNPRVVGLVNVTGEGVYYLETGGTWTDPTHALVRNTGSSGVAKSKGVGV